MNDSFVKVFLCQTFGTNKTSFRSAWVCHSGCEAYKRRLTYIVTSKNFGFKQLYTFKNYLITKVLEYKTFYINLYALLRV